VAACEDLLTCGILGDWQSLCPVCKRYVRPTSDDLQRLGVLNWVEALKVMRVEGAPVLKGLTVKDGNK
jgi:hypothetical protein